MGLKKNINIGLIGAGNIAQEYLKVIKDLKNVRCAAIFSRTPSRVKPFYKKYQIGKICYSIEEFLNQDNLDGIIIAINSCLLYTSPSPRDGLLSRMPSSA